MVISTNTRQAYSEVDEFLNIISAKNRNKVPNYLREFFNKEKDESYIKGIDINVPIKEQALKEETLAIIAWLNLEYWCQDKNEKERLREIYEKNEEKYNELLQIAFNPDDIFKPREQSAPNTSIVPNKESKIKKIILKIKNMFFNKKDKN